MAQHQMQNIIPYEPHGWNFQLHPAYSSVKHGTYRLTAIQYHMLYITMAKIILQKAIQTAFCETLTCVESEVSMSVLVKTSATNSRVKVRKVMKSHVGEPLTLLRVKCSILHGNVFITYCTKRRRFCLTRYTAPVAMLYEQVFSMSPWYLNPTIT